MLEHFNDLPHGPSGVRELPVLDRTGQDLVDWRAHFEKRPLAMLGVAFVGGLLAANMVSGGRSPRRDTENTLGETTSRRPKPQRDSNDTWTRLRSDIGVAAAGVAIEAISKALSGIKENLIEPVRKALRPEEQLPFPDPRFGGMGAKPQGNGYQG